jgi:hypothetical protein
MTASVVHVTNLTPGSDAPTGRPPKIDPLIKVDTSDAARLAPSV